MASPFRRQTDGVEIFVRLTPKSSRDEVGGVTDFGGKTVLQARVRAVPEDGKANKAIAELIAAQLGVPKSSIHLASGQTSRLKTLFVTGDAAMLERKIIAWLERIG